MSLSPTSRQATSRELHENLRRSGLSPDCVREELHFSAEQFDATLAVATTAKAHEVWLMRDFLEEAVIDRGREPCPYSVLTPEMRDAARRWFPRTRRNHI